MPGHETGRPQATRPNSETKDTDLRSRARSAAVQAAVAALQGDGHPGRATVLGAVAVDLVAGPAPVRFRTISARCQEPSPMGRRKVDALLSHLIAEGFLVLVAEADPKAEKPRTWELGPSIARAYLDARRAEEARA
jgi:hypothetical protein